MKIHSRKHKDVWILTLEGRLDAQSASLFKKNIFGFIKENNPLLILDFRHVEFVDSTGLGALISILRKIQSQEGQLALTNVNTEVESIFEVTRLHKLFKIEANLDHAIESLR